MSPDGLLHHLRHDVAALVAAERRGELPAADPEFWADVKQAYKALGRLLLGEPEPGALDEVLEGDDSGYTPLDDFWRDELGGIVG